jgi:hypothetical protein
VCCCNNGGTIINAPAIYAVEGTMGALSMVYPKFPPRRVTDRQPDLADQSEHIAHMAHRNSLRRHRPLPKGETLGPTKRPNPHPLWRDQIGMGGGIILEQVAASNRNWWRDHLGIRN